MRHCHSDGTEISAFIDYEESLRKCISDFEECATDWTEIFNETKRIRPKKEDLGFEMKKRLIFSKILFNSNSIDITTGELVIPF